MNFASKFFTVTLAVALSASIAFAQPAPTTTTLIAPIQLKPASNAPITLHMNDDSKIVYQAIGKVAGINVLFDSDYVSKHIQVDLTSVSLSDALRIVADISGTFSKPVTSDTIFVAQNNHTKHYELDDLTVQTFYLTNASQQSDANEEVTALRNLLPSDDKVYLVANQNAVTVRATADDIALVQKLLTDLDRPRKSYRLTYTVSEKDGGKLVRTEQYAMVVTSGQTTTLKQGSKVPLVTGSYSAGASDKTPAGVQTQMTYIDVGMNFDATLIGMGDNAMLKSSVEQSSIAPETSGVGPQDPIVRQTSLKGVALLAPGKPQVLGSLDIPGSTTHLDIEVLMQPLP